MKRNLALSVVVGLASFALGVVIGPLLRDQKTSLAAAHSQAIDPRVLDYNEPIRRLPGIRPSASPHSDIVCELAAFRVGNATYDRDQFATLFARGGRDFRRSVTGMRFTVLEPERFRGRILTMAYDGVLASGDPIYQFYFGHRYVMKISESRIGLDDYADMF
jgi:hypothetical protein